MISIYLSSKKTLFLRLTKNEAGEFKLNSYEVFETPSLLENPNQAKDLAKELRKFIENDNVAVIFPESIYYTARIEAKGEDTDIADLVARELGQDKGEYISQSKQLGDKSHLNIAVPVNLSQALKLFLASLEVDLISVVPESVASFPLFKSLIGASGIVAYLTHEGSLIFYDKYGPVTAVGIENNNELGKVLADEIDKFAKSHKSKVKALVAPLSEVSNLKNFEFEIVPTSHLVERALLEIAPSGLDGLDLDTNPATLGPVIAQPEELTDFSDKLLSEKPALKEKIPLVEALKDEPRKIFSLDSSKLNTEPKSNKKYFMIGLVLLLLGIVGVGFGINYFSTSGSGTNVISSAPTPQPTLEPTSTPVPYNKKEIKIQILNGTSVAGGAKTYAEKFETGGFAKPTVGNAENSDFKETTVGMKAENQLLKEDVAKILGVDSSKLKFESLSNSESADVIITIGADLLSD
jgi:hypothetical protein